MNKRDLLMITGIAILLLAAVSGFELALRGVPEALPDIVTTQDDLTNLPTIDPVSLSASATPPPSSAEPTQPVATAVATEPTDEAQPVTPTASG